jgi:Na+/proline symporter
MFGTDQLFAQRLFCCADARAARKAVLASNAALLVTLLAAFVGLALFGFYAAHPLTGPAAALVAEEPDRIFPLFILSELPTGVKGLAIAGVFAAAISSLDSILAALAQTTLTTVIPKRARTVATSRALVVLFGILLCGLAIAMESLRARYPSILDLALAVVGYTVGALLAGVLLALFPLGRDGRGYRWSAPLAVLVVAACAWIPESPPAWPWRAPIGLLIAWGGGWLLSGGARSQVQESQVQSPGNDE